MLSVCRDLPDGGGAGGEACHKALRMSQPFTIEGLMTIAAGGAC